MSRCTRACTARLSADGRVRGKPLTCGPDYPQPSQDICRERRHPHGFSSGGRLQESKMICTDARARYDVADMPERVSRHAHVPRATVGSRDLLDPVCPCTDLAKTRACRERAVSTTPARLGPKLKHLCLQLLTFYSSVTACNALLRSRPISLRRDVWEGGAEESCGRGGSGRIGGGNAEARGLIGRCRMSHLRHGHCRDCQRAESEQLDYRLSRVAFFRYICPGGWKGFDWLDPLATTDIL